MTLLGKVISKLETKETTEQVRSLCERIFAEESEEYQLWAQAMLQTEEIYFELLKTASPQAARTVLPNSCKTEIIVFANLAQWHHIFKLRTPPAAEPSMRELTIPLLAEFVKMYPAIFKNK